MAYTVNNQHVFKSWDLTQMNNWNLLFSVAMFVYDLHDYKLWNTARWQEPAFDIASDLRIIHLGSSCEMLQHPAQRNINSLMVKCVWIWTAFCKYLVHGQVLVHGMRLSKYQQFLPGERDHSLDIIKGLYCVLNNILTICVKIAFQMI